MCILTRCCDKNCSLLPLDRPILIDKFVLIHHDQLRMPLKECDLKHQGTCHTVCWYRSLREMNNSSRQSGKGYTEKLVVHLDVSTTFIQWRCTCICSSRFEGS